MKKIPIKQFTKAKELHDELVFVDKEILQIEKIANEISNDKCVLDFGLKIKNLSKPDDKVEHNEWHDETLSSFYKSLFPSFMQTPQIQNKTHSSEYNFRLLDTECLQILSVILKVKNEYRNKLIHVIENLGVEI